MRGKNGSNGERAVAGLTTVDTGSASHARPCGRNSGAARYRGRTAWIAADAITWACGPLLAGLAGTGSAGLLVNLGDLIIACIVTSVAAILAAAVCGLYSGRFQAGSGSELSVVMASSGLTALSLEGISRAPHPLVDGRPTVAGITVLVSLLAMIATRAIVATVRRRPRQPAPEAVKVIVFGAGSAGTQLVHRLIRQRDARYLPVALLDDDPAKRRLRICGVRVRGGRERLAEIAAETGATVVVIAIAGGCGTGQVVRELVTLAESADLIAKVIPPIHELIAGSARIDGVRDPRITHLLGRKPVRLDLTSVAGQLAGRRILVTGAGGSIGSELCRQLHLLHPASLVMLDRDESALHAIQLALHGRALLDSDETVLADIRDAARIREVFAHARPEIVFHAAAVKHLPLLERYPTEALKTNVVGTLNVLQAAAACGVRSFVNISTDKAADPVSVLGTSKRITERLTAHMAGQVPGIWVSVRFGNVLGSRGSLLGSLSAQITSGGPVTVTHPQVARYFMTATEAIQLVLQAMGVGRSGEVLVLDMGEQVRIADLARRMAATAPHRVEIVFTGLRPGEKLTEDLLGTGEPDHRPRHPLVRQVPVPTLEPGEVVGIAHLTDPDDVRTALARLVVTSGLVPSPSSVPAPGPVPQQCQTVPPAPLDQPSTPLASGSRPVIVPTQTAASAPLWACEVEAAAARPFYRGKRLLDLVMVSLVIVPATALCAAAALAHLLAHGRPVLFRQQRVGCAGRLFVIWKLRTMRGLPEGPDAVQGTADDQITAVGRVLRRLSLDELPQLVNVLRGEMSLVGPRPTLPYQVRRYTDRQHLRLQALPGLTGLAQVRGRQRLSWPERIEWDLRYLGQQSLQLDLIILLLTVWTVLARGGTSVSHDSDPIARVPERVHSGA